MPTESISSDGGEPFLNKEIFSIIEFLRQRGHHISMDSNLNIADERIIDHIADSGIDFLSVSLDGVDQGSYSNYRKGGSFETAFTNMKKLALAPNGPRKIQWQYLVSRKSAEFVARAQALAHEASIPVVFQDIGMYLNVFYKSSDELEREWMTDSQIQEASRLCQPGEVCMYMYNEPFVDPDGRVYPCCHAARTPAALLEEGYQHVVGSLHDNTLFEIWNNDYYRYMRMRFAGREQPDGELKPVCLACRMYLDSRQKGTETLLTFSGDISSARPSSSGGSLSGSQGDDAASPPHPIEGRTSSCS
jgi:radical SAM protein with 4Fe4S-binding SPASM domain